METKEMNLVIKSGRDIVYEDASVFERSVHREAYKKAHQITDEIIRQNSQFEEYKNSSTTRESYGTELRNLKQISNILFFSGERGAGKTSAMLSYMEFLKDYYRNSSSYDSEKIIGKFRFNEKDLMFTGLEYIDASRLADKEDILGSVLAKMAKKWLSEERKGIAEGGLRKSRDYEYKKRQLQMQFNEIYNCLTALKTKKEILEQEDDMFFDTLQKLSFTENLKESFEKLVEMYVDIMQYANANETRHYLVIPIDDLDMNIKNGYEMLEQIRKFLMIPKVIVLISANFEQLEKICYNHYIEEFRYLKESDDYIQKLTREYLEKLVPNYHQIHLKTGNRWENLKKATIQFKYQEDENEKKLITKTLTGDTMAEGIRGLLQDKFGIRFGKESRALKYLIPTTLRELATWLSSVVPLEDREEASVRQYEDNMKMFWAEVFPNVQKQYLSETEKTAVHNLMQRNAYEQRKWLRTYITDIVSRNSFRTTSNETVYVEESIVELLWILHNKIDVNEPFYNILIIYFTAKLSELIVYVSYAEEDKELAENSLRELKHYYQGGLFGRSETEMIADFMRTTSLFDTENPENGVVSSIQYARFPFRSIEAKTESLNPGFLFGTEKNRKSKPAIRKLLDKQACKDYCDRLLFYTFIPKQSIHYNLVKDRESFFINERKGKFSLSGAFVYQIIGLELRDIFLDEVSMCYGGIDCAAEDVAKERRIKPLGKNLIESFPLDSMEFLIDIGEWMRDRKEVGYRISKLGDKPGLDQEIEKILQQYYSRWESCFKELDKKYGTNYEISLWNAELCSKIKDNQLHFISELAKNIASETDWETRIPSFSEDTWGNS